MKRSVGLAGLVLALLLVAGSASAAAAGGSITEFKAGLQTNSFPEHIVLGPNGNLWFTDRLEAIGTITPSGSITEFSAGLNPASEPSDIVVGPDNNLWFTDPTQDGTPAIGRITPSGTITEFSSGVNQASNPISVREPTDMIVGPDGNLWFTDRDYRGKVQPAIGRITPSGSITEFDLPADAFPEHLVVGPDGNLWFTEWSEVSSPKAIGKITPSGTITEYPTGGKPIDIVVGPDNNLWFTDASGAIGRITTGGTLQKFSAGLSASSEPEEIVAGADGNLWFTDHGSAFEASGAIGRITPAGVITEFGGHLRPSSIALGPDGNIWAGDYSHVINRITPSGTITSFRIGMQEDAEVRDFATGPGSSNLWFTAGSSFVRGGIGRLSPVSASMTPLPTLEISISGEGGTVVSAPAGIQCPPACAAAFPLGTRVTLTAAPSPGFGFRGWYKGPCSGTTPLMCEVTMSDDVETRADFEEEPEGEAEPEQPGSKSGEPVGAPVVSTPASTDQGPAAAVSPAPVVHHRRPLKCRKGFKKKRLHGKARCVKTKRRHRRRRRHRQHQAARVAAAGGIVVGEGAVGVHLGDSKRQVLGLLGKPVRVEPTFLVFPKPCLCLVEFKGNKTTSIDVFSKSQQTDRGVGVGTSYEKTVAAYPEARCYHPAVYGETSRYCVLKSKYKGRSVETVFAFFEQDLGVRDVEIRFG